MFPSHRLDSNVPLTPLSDSGTSSLSASYFHPTAPDFNISNLSPIQKHRASVERIRQIFEQERFELPDLNIPTQPPVPPFSADEDENSLASIGYSAPVVGGVLGNLGSGMLSSAGSVSSSVSRFRSSTQSSAGSRSLTAIFAGAVIFSTGVFFVAGSYRDYANGIRTDVLTAYRQITDEGIDRQDFRNFVGGVNQRKLESYFSRVFEICNPTPIGYMLLTMGIAEDSFGHHLQAQEYYQTSLNYHVQPNLRDCIHYVYARSLRLSNQARQVITDQLDQIGQNSPVYRLSQIERQALEDGINEVFDGHIPACFICAITQELMIHPVYYERENHRYYFEEAAITAWLRQHQRCPLTQQPLTIQELLPDQALVDSIAVWNQTKLKHQ